MMVLARATQLADRSTNTDFLGVTAGPRASGRVTVRAMSNS